MEALAALGVAAAAVQFYTFVVDFYPKLVDLAKSPTGDLRANASLAEHAQRIKQLCDDTSPPQLAGGQTCANMVDNATQTRIVSLHDKCVTISTLLLQELEKLKIKAKPDGSRSKTSALKLILKSTVKSSKILELQSNLKALQEDLNTTLLADIRTMVQRSQSDTNVKLDAIIHRIRHMTSAVPHHPTADPQLDVLSTGIAELVKKHFDQQEANAASQRARQHFLNSLWFQEIFLRQETIPPAYGITFQWILNLQESLAESLVESPAEIYSRQWRNTLRPWLRDANTSGAYWIQGIPGSGKSTLLSVIYDHNELDEHLRAWSGGEKVLRASFFIWKSGSVVQMQHNSVYRALAYQLLKSNDSLFTALNQSAEARYGPNFDMIPTWNTRSLQILLFTLVSASPYTFLLIDGLDEAQETHSDLLAFLKTLWQLPKVKICLSSRPEPVFSQELGSLPGLHLQELTRSDMKAMIHGKIVVKWASRNFVDDLTQKIYERAEGVFLWAKLVVESVNKGSADGDTEAELEQKVLKTPRGLEELYCNLLQDLDDTDKQVAGMYLGLIDCWNRLREQGQTFVCRGYECDDHPDLPLLLLPDATTYKPAASMTTQTACAHEHSKISLERMRARVQSRCRGLIQLSASNTSDQTESFRGDVSISNLRYMTTIMPGGHVQFLHRTVRDFILDNNTGQLLVVIPSSQQLHETILRGYASVSHYCEHIPKSLQWTRWIRTACLSAHAQCQRSLNNTQTLQALADEIFAICSQGGKHSFNLSVRRHSQSSFQEHVSDICSPPIQSESSKRRLVLALAAASGSYQTLEECDSWWTDVDILRCCCSHFLEHCHEVKVKVGEHSYQSQIKSRDGLRTLGYLIRRLSASANDDDLRVVTPVCHYFIQQLRSYFNIPKYVEWMRTVHGFPLTCGDNTLCAELVKTCKALRPALLDAIQQECRTFHHTLWYYAVTTSGEAHQLLLETRLGLVVQLYLLRGIYPCAAQLLEVLDESLKSPWRFSWEVLINPTLDEKYFMKQLEQKETDSLSTELKACCLAADHQERQQIAAGVHERIRNIASRAFGQHYVSLHFREDTYNLFSPLASLSETEAAPSRTIYSTSRRSSKARLTVKLPERHSPAVSILDQWSTATARHML